MMYLPHQRYSSIMRDGESLNRKKPWPLSSALRPFCSAKPAVVDRYLHLYHIRRTAKDTLTVSLGRRTVLVHINYTCGRKLNRALIERLATCKYITEHRNLFITGATGNGKTYLACAFGMEACRQRYKTKYVRLLDLLLELEMARNDSTYKKVQGKYANPVLLIIDEWLLLKPTESEQHDILELLHRRRRRSSTIFCSQYDSNGWYDQLGGDDSPLAEAILDRIKHDAYKINIIPTDPANYRSMREVYGLDPALSE